MLGTLHDTINDRERKIYERKKKAPIFHFFIIHHEGRVRFFLQTEKRHQEFLESQLYAHYPDIEITHAALPIEDGDTYQIQEAAMHHIESETLKIYVSLKDRTEKETIDPLSSITSALAKAEKHTTTFVRVDFQPLADHLWRE
jgi:hypothetical protein